MFGDSKVTEICRDNSFKSQVKTLHRKRRRLKWRCVVETSSRSTWNDGTVPRYCGNQGRMSRTSHFTIVSRDTAAHCAIWSKVNGGKGTSRRVEEAGNIWGTNLYTAVTPSSPERTEHLAGIRDISTILLHSTWTFQHLVLGQHRGEDVVTLHCTMVTLWRCTSCCDIESYMIPRPVAAATRSCTTKPQKIFSHGSLRKRPEVCVAHRRGDQQSPDLKSPRGA